MLELSSRSSQVRRSSQNADHCSVNAFCVEVFLSQESATFRECNSPYIAQCAFWVVRWPCSQNGAVSDTIRRRGGYGGIFRKEGMDTGPYFRGNHGSRVWDSRFTHESCFPSNRTSRDICMLNNLSRRNF